MNDPLYTGCPCCSGSGLVSYLRSGEWINRHCPGRNGPVDVDSAPLTHELDNDIAKRKARIEYKRPGESVSPGQERHNRAELESTHPSWKTLLVLVLDEGQETLTDPVRFWWRTSARPALMWSEATGQGATVDELGRRIAAWLWTGSSALEGRAA